MSDWTDLFNGQSLEGWTAPEGHQWRLASGVRLHPENPKLFSIEPGAGIMVNGDTGRTWDIRTVMEHGSCELHVEYCVSQGSNSGVYLQGQYEIQILDSWGTPDSDLTYTANGGIYARWIEESRTSYDGAAPRTNASRPPGEWQSYDILFHAPKFDGDGVLVGRARFERVIHNGVVIHENFECSGPTRGAWSETDIPRGPLRLQGDHGPVAYRNIRIRSLE
jgi:3-keto-disaccharide hydrolase